MGTLRSAKIQLSAAVGRPERRNRTDPIVANASTSLASKAASIQLGARFESTSRLMRVCIDARLVYHSASSPKREPPAKRSKLRAQLLFETSGKIGLLKSSQHLLESRLAAVIRHNGFLLREIYNGFPYARHGFKCGLNTRRASLRSGHTGDGERDLFTRLRRALATGLLWSASLGVGFATSARHNDTTAKGACKEQGARQHAVGSNLHGMQYRAHAMERKEFCSSCVPHSGDARDTSLGRTHRESLCS